MPKAGNGTLCTKSRPARTNTSTRAVIVWTRQTSSAGKRYSKTWKKSGSAWTNVTTRMSPSRRHALSLPLTRARVRRTRHLRCGRRFFQPILQPIHGAPPARSPRHGRYGVYLAVTATTFGPIGEALLSFRGSLEAHTGRPKTTLTKNHSPTNPTPKSAIKMPSATCNPPSVEGWARPSVTETRLGSAGS